MQTADPLPYESGVRQRYLQALEVRRQVAASYESALTVEDMMMLNDRLRWAIHELQTTRNRLAAP